MRNNFIFLLAIRYFLARKNEKFVSIISRVSLIGITIGVAALIIVMSVMNGFHIELTNNIIGLSGDINISAQDKVIEDYDKVIAMISKDKFIKRITPVVTNQALALGQNINSGVLVKGIDIKDLKYKGRIVENVIAGSFADYHGNNVIALGTELAYKLGLRVGEKIKMIAPNLISTAFGSMPRTKEFTVVAIFNSGLYDYDAITVIMPLVAARKFFSLGGNINCLEINIIDHEQAAEQAYILQQLLKDNQVIVSSWKESNKQFLQALKIERTTMFVILSLIIIVAAFNIVSSLFMIVKDKNKDIAILRTIGASLKQIMFIFIINGMIIGITGVFLGVISGLIIAANIENIRKFLEQLSGWKIFDPAIYFLYNLPSLVSMLDVILVASMALALCFLATIYPAYKAARLNPVEAMRYE